MLKFLLHYFKTQEMCEKAAKKVLLAVIHVSSIRNGDISKLWVQKIALKKIHEIC